MPNIGERRRGHEIDKSPNYDLFEWAQCIICGNSRWTRVKKGCHPAICSHCMRIENSKNMHQTMDKHPNWIGGRVRTRGKRVEGYFQIKLACNDFFYPMAKKSGYVLEHRLIMAKHLGRCLHSWEIVHHKNGIKDDNRLENLQLVTDDRHKQITVLETRIKYLEQRVTMLEAEIVLLKTNNVLEIVNLDKR